MDGWIKWYRQSIDNEIWLNDRTAWQIFEYFLAIADYKTGRVNRAYSTISEFLGIPKSTLHKAIKRLKKAKMVNDIVNDKYTIFTIVNWHKYQNGKQNGERKVNAKGTQSEHIQEVKKLISKEEREALTQFLINKGMNKDLVKNELAKFISYWTELNHSGTKQRWQLEKTFEVKKRLVTWFNNINKFGGQNGRTTIKVKGRRVSNSF